MSRREIVVMAEGDFYKWRDACEGEVEPRPPSGSSFTFSFSAETKLTDMEHEILERLSWLPKGGKYEFLYPAYSSDLDKSQSLEDLGVLSGEIALVGYKRWF
jgi:hypothetical protein